MFKVSYLGKILVTFYERALNFVKFASYKRPFELEKPKVIQFPVIDICNSRCQMCKIWENKQSRDITVDELRKGLKDQLFQEVQAIGFNGGEPTLRKDLLELVQATVECLPNLRHVSLITNGYKVKEIKRVISLIGEYLNSKNINFDVMVSLDGFGDVHDAVRGKPGNFIRAEKVLDFAIESPHVNEVRVGCTIIKENVLSLVPLLEYCISKNVYVKYRLGISHKRLYTENLLDPYMLSPDEKYECIEFIYGLIEHYEKGYLQNFFYHSLAEQMASKEKRKAGCDWQFRGATITADGGLAYCAVQSDTLLESIAEGSPYDAYFNNVSHLNEIVSNKCDDCTHDYMGPPPRSIYWVRIKNKVQSVLLSRVRSARALGFLMNIKNVISFNKELNKYRKIEEKPVVLSKMNKASISVLICGWYGTETLGDKAILGGVVAIFNVLYAELQISFTIASLNPYITLRTRSQMEELNGVKVISIEKAMNSIASFNIVAFGGGPLMSLRELAPMQVLFEKASKHGVKKYILGCGVGPLNYNVHSKSVSKILEMSDCSVLRDGKSKTLAKQIVSDSTAANIEVAEDPAFYWLQNIVRKKRKKRTSNITLLLGLRDFPSQQYASGHSLKRALKIKTNYENSIINCLQKIVHKYPDVVIQPLPMCTNHFGGDDRWFFREILRKVPELSNNIDAYYLGRELPPEDYVKAFETATVGIAMRFHSLVFSLATKLPCVAIDYTLGRGKVFSLAEKANVPLKSIAELDSEWLFNQVDILINNRSDDITGPSLELEFDSYFKSMREAS